MTPVNINTQTTIPCLHLLLVHDLCNPMIHILNVLVHGNIAYYLRSTHQRCRFSVILETHIEAAICIGNKIYKVN